MKIFDYDGYPAVFLHEVSEALQDKDCKLAAKDETIATLEGVVCDLEGQMDAYRRELGL